MLSSNSDMPQHIQIYNDIISQVTNALKDIAILTERVSTVKETSHKEIDKLVNDILDIKNNLHQLDLVDENTKTQVEFLRKTLSTDKSIITMLSDSSKKTLYAHSKFTTRLEVIETRLNTLETEIDNMKTCNKERDDKINEVRNLKKIIVSISSIIIATGAIWAVLNEILIGK